MILSHYLSAVSSVGYYDEKEKERDTCRECTYQDSLP
jgi:hypothetical protein